MCNTSVPMCPDTSAKVAWHFSTVGAEVSGHFRTSADQSYGQFGTGAELSSVPKCLRVRSVCTRPPVQCGCVDARICGFFGPENDEN